MNYSNLARIVSNLIKPPTGQNITITKYSNVEYNVEDGTVEQDSTDISTYGVIFDAKDGTHFLDNTQIQLGDKLLLVGDVGVVNLGDLVTTENDEVFRIIQISGVSPAGTRVINKLLLRK
jgi:hypothetical protein